MDAASYWLEYIEKLERMETKQLLKTYAKQFSENISFKSMDCVRQIVENLENLKNTLDAQKFLRYPHGEANVPAYHDQNWTSATMFRAPSMSTFLRFALLAAFLVVSVILMVDMLIQIEFMKCGPLTRALRSYIPSYDEHIVASKKRSEIKEKIEKIEAESKAQIKKMKAELKVDIKEAEAELKQKVKEMKTECEQRVRERRERLLAEGGTSEEPMLFSWMEFFQGMGKMIEEMGFYTVLFFMALLYLLQALTNGKFSDRCKKKEQVLEVQTAEKETQVSGIINVETEEDKEWSVL
jgi:hypothetical protein